MPSLTYPEGVKKKNNNNNSSNNNNNNNSFIYSQYKTMRIKIYK